MLWVLRDRSANYILWWKTMFFENNSSLQTRSFPPLDQSNLEFAIREFQIDTYQKWNIFNKTDLWFFPIHFFVTQVYRRCGIIDPLTQNRDWVDLLKISIRCQIDILKSGFLHVRSVSFIMDTFGIHLSQQMFRMTPIYSIVPPEFFAFYIFFFYLFDLKGMKIFARLGRPLRLSHSTIVPSMYCSVAIDFVARSVWWNFPFVSRELPLYSHILVRSMNTLANEYRNHKKCLSSARSWKKIRRVELVIKMARIVS